MPLKTPDPIDGVLIYECNNWDDFNDFVTKRLYLPLNNIYRGQRDSGWLLEPTLTRLLRKLGKPDDGKHLERFRYAVRGRRGPSPRAIPDTDQGRDELWALGQHHGLATPLLDWTSSPYVAAFFAYAKDETPKSGQRAVFGLNRDYVEQASKALIAKAKPDEIITFVAPLTDENARLVNQGALFTKSPPNQDIETWVKNQFNGKKVPCLYKVLLPDSVRDQRKTALKALNRMNINYLSLYPDLEGASLHCNMQLSIDGY